MNFIIDHWATILLIVIVAANIVYDIINFKKLPEEQKVEKIKGWLLQAVMIAEKDYGSGTGALKLSVVYAEFCKQLPWLAKTISFETFSNYVDEALGRMKDMLQKNKNIAAIVDGGGGE